MSVSLRLYELLRDWADRQRETNDVLRGRLYTLRNRRRIRRYGGDAFDNGYDGGPTPWSIGSGDSPGYGGGGPAPPPGGVPRG